MKKYVVIYLDILGFKWFLNKDSGAALGILNDFHGVLGTRRQLEHLDLPFGGPGGPVKSLAERNASDSFSYFLPMSDSVFILSEEPDKVAAQLSTFLRDSFLFGGYVYGNSDPSDVHKQCIKEVRINESGEVEKNTVEENWYPVLFRGGISYGDVEVVQTPAIRNGKDIMAMNVVGRGVVQAVELEQSGFAGPRILCDGEFVDQLTGPTNKYLRREGDAWELLWPGFNYLEGDDERAQSYVLNEFFYPALALWQCYSEKKPAKHYRAFLELIVRSHLAFAECASDPELVNEYLHQKLDEAELELYASVRNSQLIFPNTK